MSREIKFRGKRLFGHGWVYGDLVHVSGFGTKHVEIYRDEVDEQRSPEVDPRTVGQFTGLKDKGGKDIYEGDILLASHEPIKGSVSWNETLAHYSIGGLDQGMFYSLKPSRGLSHSVIGTIHDEEAG